jgi:hypothetical protein
LSIVAACTAVLYAVMPAVGVAYFGFVVAVWGVKTVRFRRQARRFVAEHNAAIAALARGELARARATFPSWAENSRMPRVSMANVTKPIPTSSRSRRNGCIDAAQCGPARGEA